MVIRLIVATIILIAAVLKAHQLATTPSLGDGLLHARWFNIFVVEFELFFGVWLVLGMLPKLTWLATVGCFSVFTLVSFYEAILGEKSCGCFGNVTVNPWVTMVFDLLVIALLVYVRPSGMKNTETLKCFLNRYSSRLMFCAGIFLLSGGATYNWIAQTNHERLEHVGQVLESNVVQLDPKSWIGKEFPLRDYVIDGQELMQGTWTILLVRSGCGHCAEAKAQLIKNTGQNQHYVAFLDVVSEVLQPDVNENVKNFRLMSDIVWAVETPLVIVLCDGIVKDVQTQEQMNQ
jgi:hypothetical protein